MKKTLTLVVAAVALALLASGGSAQASLVANGGFEATAPGANGGDLIYIGAGIETIGPSTSGNTVGAWNVTAGSVDLVTGYFVAPEGVNSLDLSGIDRGTISQSIFLNAGTYQLSFLMSGNQGGPPTTKTVDVSLFGPSDQFSTTFAAYGNGTWATETANFTVASGSYLLQFKDISAGNSAYGATLDNIQLTAVPEPTTVVAGVLMLLPFGVSTLRILRKTRTA